MSKKEKESQVQFSRRDILKLLGAGAIAATTELGEVARAEEPRRADVVIVGAGFAGLIAGRTLMRAGRKVAILEARNRVGGRVKAGTVAGRAVDVGGMWAGPTQDRVLATIKEYGLHLVPQFEKGKNFNEVVHKRFVAEGNSAGWDKQTDEEYARVLAEMNALGEKLPLEAPWNMPRAEEYDMMSADDWFRATTKNEEVLGYLRGTTRGIFAADAYQISFLYFLFYSRSGDNFEMQANFGQGSAQAWTVQETMHAVAVKTAAELGAAVKLETPVRGISQSDGGVTVESDKGNWSADYAIVAVPPPLSVRMRYDPVLPPERDILVQHMPMGSVIKYWVAYDRPFWRETGLSGLAVSDEPPSDLLCADMSPVEGKPGLLVGIMEARNGLKWTGRPMAERKKAVVERLVSFFGPEAARPIDYEDQDWPSDPWSRGCYGASMAPGIMTTVGRCIRQPHGRIHWAGTETAERWMGYIDGAIRSGERAAAEVLALYK
jgi:monoamine oxidase